MFANPFAFWTMAVRAQIEMTTMFWSLTLAPYAGRPKVALRVVTFNPGLERTPHRAALTVVR